MRGWGPDELCAATSAGRKADSRVATRNRRFMMSRCSSFVLEGCDPVPAGAGAIACRAVGLYAGNGTGSKPLTGFERLRRSPKPGTIRNGVLGARPAAITIYKNIACATTLDHALPSIRSA